MARNLSVEQFQQLMDSIPSTVAIELKNVPWQSGQLLAAAMRRAVHLGQDGVHELQQSIRVEQGRRPLQVLVKAGGPLTTRLGAGGFFSSRVAYDYALANEFGTQKMTRRAFFWPTYRQYKKAIRTTIQQSAKAAIAKVVPLK